MSNTLLLDLLNSCWQTIYMVFVAGFIAFVIGLPLGVLLFLTRAQGLISKPTVYRSLAVCVNILRAIPFIILLVAIIPFTRLLVGTSIGTTAAIVPLSIAAIPFVGRLAENILSELAPGLIEAGLAMGASLIQIIYKILLPEALPALLNSITLTLINLVGYSAMAGAIGGGGLGDFAIRYGYERFDVKLMLITIIILLILVQGIQYLGDLTVKKLSHRL